MCPTLLYFNLIFGLNKQYISIIIPLYFKDFSKHNKKIIFSLNSYLTFKSCIF